MFRHRRLDGLQVFGLTIRVRFGVLVSVEQLSRTRFGIEASGPHTRKQPAYEVRAVGRKLEERFVHQQFQHVLPPDIDHESDLRLQDGA